MRPQAPAAILGRCLPLLLALGVHRAGRAELLYFANGGQVQAPATVQGGEVRVTIPTGDYTFRESDFVKIVEGGCPEREWPAKRENALRHGAEARLTAAWWALENGLVAEAVAMVRSARAADPRHEATRRLCATLDRLDRPMTDPETGPLREALRVPLEPARGPHVLLLHQRPGAEARARLDLLERVFTAYYLDMTALGFDLTVPETRAVAVDLGDRRDYLRFLESQGAGAFRNTLGYFHPTYRAVVTFDGRSSARWRAVSDAIGRAPNSRDRARQRLLLETERLARDDGTAAHEMVHLLVRDSGLSQRPGEFPQWLHEGLAAQFEVIRGGRWAGIGRAHDLRLPDRDARSSPPALLPLLRDTGFGRGYCRETYANAWSLVYYLRKTRPRAFLTYLDLLHLPPEPHGPEEPGRPEAVFRTAFGPDLRALELDWHHYFSHVTPPLQRESPGKNSTAVRFRGYLD